MSNVFLENLKKLSDDYSLKGLESLLGEDSELYIVGGAVRDAFLNRQDFDLDLATKLRPNQIREKLLPAQIRSIETGIEHGTLTLLLDKAPVEITTFRLPGPRSGSGYSDTIETDLNGRDFTINALAYSVSNQTLIDPFNGTGDLKEGIIRGVGDALERFQEDPLRILRMVRLASDLNFEIEKNTWEAANEVIGEIEEISVERIRDELCKMLVVETPSRGMKLLKDLNLLHLITPRILESIDCEQNEYHIEDVFQHTLTVLDRAPRILEVRLAALFHDLGKPESLSVGPDGRRHFYKHELIGRDIAKLALTDLRLPKHTVRTVAKLVEYHMRPFECGPAAVRRLRRDLAEDFDKWRLLKIADKSPTLPEADFQKSVSDFDQLVKTEIDKEKEPQYGILAISGSDLIQLGMKPGPLMGKFLKQLEELVIEDPSKNEREFLLAKAKHVLKDDTID